MFKGKSEVPFRLGVVFQMCDVDPELTLLLTMMVDILL